MKAIIAVVGDTPEQVVSRALAACTCAHPERHHLYAPDLLKQVLRNDGEPEWLYALVLPDDGAWNLDAEGVHRYEQAPEAH